MNASLIVKQNESLKVTDQSRVKNTLLTTLFKLETQLFKEIKTVINRKLPTSKWIVEELWFGHLSTVTITYFFYYLMTN